MRGVHAANGLRWAGVLVHVELGRRDAGAEHACRGHVVARHGEAAERALQVVERQPGVEKRAEHHVAGDAGEAVEVQDTRHEGR